MKPSPSDPEKLIYAFAKTDEELIELQEHENPVSLRWLTCALSSHRSSRHD